MSRIRIAVVFGLGLFLLWTACRGGELPGAKIKVGEKTADFTLPDVNGKAHRLYEFEGKKAVAIIFFATRCPYSNAFNHVMANLAHEYESRGVAVTGSVLLALIPMKATPRLSYSCARLVIT